MRLPGVAGFLAVVLTPVVLCGQMSSNARCDSIQYRFIDQNPLMTAPRHPSVQDGQSYALRDSVVVDGRSIAEIQVWAHHVGTDTTWDVLARLTPAGAKAMAEATTRNLGQNLAVLLGSTIIEHGIIEGTLGSRVPIRIGATHREADSLAVRVRRASGASCQDP